MGNKKLKKILGWLILSQFVCLILFAIMLPKTGFQNLNGVQLASRWLVAEFATAMSAFACWIINLAIDWIYED